MKPISSAILLCLLPLAAVRGQQPEPPKQEAPAYQQEFSNLPKEKREEFLKHLLEGQRLFSQNRVFEAIEEANKAAAVFDNSPELENLFGACQVEFRNFDKAIEHFKKADEIFPGQPAVAFNVAELQFVSKDWAAAEAGFNKVLEMTRKNNNPKDFQLSRLVEFKMMLCKLKLGQKEEATKMATQYDFLDDSPYPYYAEAAIAYSEGRDIEAESAMARGARIFQNPGMLAPWQDTMVEFGYIKGFFGGDAEEEAED